MNKFDKIKKGFLCAICVIILGFETGSVVQAANTRDTSFYFDVNGGNGWDTSPRAKDNTSSIYVKINSAPKGKAMCRVLANVPAAHHYVDCILGRSRKVVLSTGGSNKGGWFIETNAFESGAREVKLSFSQTYGGSGSVSGFWSPDSIGRYPVANKY